MRRWMVAVVTGCLWGWTAPASAFLCYVANDVVPYNGYFHDDTGTLIDPTSPTATVRITPFTGTATYTALTAPAKLNAETGRYGGEYTIAASPTPGTYEIALKGTVPTSKNVGGVVQVFQVRASCPPMADVTKWNGTAVATPSVAGVPEVDVTHYNGSASTLAPIGTTGNPTLDAAEIGEVSGAVVASTDCTNSATVFDTNLGASLYTRTDGPKFSGLTFTSGILIRETREITAYNINGCITTRAFSGTPSAADTFVVINK